MSTGPQSIGPRERTCGLCARTLQLDPLKGGWRVIDHQGATVWACPDCGRRLDRWGW